MTGEGRSEFDVDDIRIRFFFDAVEQCQCTEAGCRHEGRCPQKLLWDRRGDTGNQGWHADHIDGNLANTKPENLQILCTECHETKYQRLQST